MKTYQVIISLYWNDIDGVKMSFERSQCTFNENDARDAFLSILKDMREYVDNNSSRKCENFIFDDDDFSLINASFYGSITVKSDNESKFKDGHISKYIVEEYIPMAIRYFEDPFDHIVKMSDSCHLHFDINGNYIGGEINYNDQCSHKIEAINGFLKGQGLKLEVSYF